MTAIQLGRGERWALLSAVAYTVVNVTLRSAAPTIDGALGSLIRLIPVAVVAWAFVVRDGARDFRPSGEGFIGWRLIGALVVGGAGSFVLGNILYFSALREGGLGITAGGIQSGSVLGGIWMGFLFLRERPRNVTLAGAGLIIFGLAAIAWAQTTTVHERWWLGLALAVAAGTTYAFANATARAVQRRRPLLWVTLAASSLGGAVPLMLIVGIRVASGEHLAGDAGSALVVFLAGFANAVALGGLAMAVRHAPVASVNTISSASIVFSFIASVAIFGETGSAPMVLGILAVTAGIIVAQLRRGPAAPEPAPVAPATEAS
jgi:drug/metabolite transporter (DMT)-like permease